MNVTKLIWHAQDPLHTEYGMFALIVLRVSS